jgi:hypothetical protein
LRKLQDALCHVSFAHEPRTKHKLNSCRRVTQQQQQRTFRYAVVESQLCELINRAMSASPMKPLQNTNSTAARQ